MEERPAGGEDELEETGELEEADELEGEEAEGEGEETEPEELEEEPEDDTPPDLDSRILCSDGACIGIIGPDGNCKVCGTPMAEQDAPLFKVSLAKKAESEDEQEDDDSWPEEEDEDDGPPDDLESRELCADGTCIGLIGPNGRCKVCGRAAGDEPSEEEEQDEPPVEDAGEEAAEEAAEEEEEAPAEK